MRGLLPAHPQAEQLAVVQRGAEHAEGGAGTPAGVRDDRAQHAGAVALGPDGPAHAIRETLGHCPRVRGQIQFVQSHIVHLDSSLPLTRPAGRTPADQTAAAVASSPQASCTASATVPASGIARSSLVIRNSRRVWRRAQATCRLPPCAAARRAAPASTPSPAASMKLTRSRSATIGRPLAASPNSRSLRLATAATSTSPARVMSTYPGSYLTRIAGIKQIASGCDGRSPASASFTIPPHRVPPFSPTAAQTPPRFDATPWQHGPQRSDYVDRYVPWPAWDRSGWVRPAGRTG